MKVLLLTLNVTVSDNVAILADNITRPFVNRAHREFRSHVVKVSDLIWHKLIVIPGVRVGAEPDQEAGDVHGPTHCCKV